jgi:hypothetical protein
MLDRCRLRASSTASSGSSNTRGLKMQPNPSFKRTCLRQAA